MSIRNIDIQITVFYYIIIIRYLQQNKFYYNFCLSGCLFRLIFEMAKPILTGLLLVFNKSLPNIFFVIL